MATSAPREIPEPEAGRFSRLYAAITGSHCSIGEGRAGLQDAAQAPLREKIVRCLWFDQFLEPAALRTEDGRRLSVFSPGYWNEGSGPDFRNAEIALDEGARLRGDVEVHVAASDWYQHGHDRDPAYARVLLHVVLRNDTGSSTVTHGDRGIPQLVLERRLSADLEEILGSLDPDGYPRAGCGREGPCCRSLRAFGVDERWVGRFLDIAGDERMLRKAARFAAQVEKSTPDDVMYEALMEAMGYSANRRGFRLLAQAVPAAQLRRLVPADSEPGEKLLVVQALLFGAGGLLDADQLLSGDELSRGYLSALKERWEASAGDLPASRVERSAWALGRTRPTNHPVRRIAGISPFLAAHVHSGLCRAMIAAVEQIPASGAERSRCRTALERFHSLFERQPQEYWAKRTSFGPETLPRPMALIGSARVTEIVVNVVIPLLLSLSRRNDESRIEQRLHNIYGCLRAPADNSVTSYVKTRVFGEAAAADRVVNSMRRHQGLLQLFHDFCENDSATCEACGFLAAVEGRAEAMR